MDYTASLKKMENGWFMAQCEQLPAAITQGSTIDEALENLKDAIKLVLESEKEDFVKRNRRQRFLRRKIAMA